MPKAPKRKAKKKSSIFASSPFRILFAVVVIMALATRFELSAETDYSESNYNAVKEYIKEIKGLPETKEREDFLLYVKHSLLDGKLSGWEFMNIKMKHRRTLDATRAIKPNKQAKELVELTESP